MNVSIIGSGYVGLVTGACLADRGHDVVCVDVDRTKVDLINAGKPTIHERGLPELLLRTAGRTLRASTDLADAVAASDLTFITVGTPIRGGRIDLGFVDAAAGGIGAALRGKPGYHTVIVKSTVLPGTTEGLVRERIESVSGKRAGEDFGLGMNPEFLTEGCAVEDFVNPGRLVLGGIDGRTHDALERLYADFDCSVPRLRTSPSTAEMIKYASNAVLATMISFSNEIARLCAAVGGVDARDVMRGVHRAQHFTSRDDGRSVTAAITAFLEAGCGFGGSCLPKDVAALIEQGSGLGVDMPLLRSVLEVNRGQASEVMRLIARHYPDLRDVPVAVLGLSFKPETDDMRESPAYPIVEKLRNAGARVTAFDPVARPVDDPRLDGVRLAGSLAEAVAEAEVVVLVTRWPEFTDIAQLLRQQRRAPLVVDGRRILDPADFERYVGIGRGIGPSYAPAGAIA